MKHIKEFVIFEDHEEWDRKKLREIEKDPVISDWLRKFKLQFPGDFYGEGVWPVIFPTGKIEDVSFFDSWDYTGEGDWNLTSSAELEGGLYLYMRAGAKGWQEPGEDVEWYDEDINAAFDFKTFDPVKIINEYLSDFPNVVYKLYTLIPEDKKREVEKETKWKILGTEEFKRVLPYIERLGL